ncbi:hypothetical protein [Pantoea agglomerans]|uniref:hypothetical protein n=1 Tax=Enterobacter agglomerans TaxID=549 RepID=UPI001784D50B|nr:hypothetical protein [Pantoea agglomerans]MBD8234600.1 hypothetical protein [Pantoea agglomerans]
MKKDIVYDLKRLGLHNGKCFVPKAALIEGDLAKEVLKLLDRLDKRIFIPDSIKHGFNQVRAVYKYSGYINQALAVMVFKAYVNEPKENFSFNIRWRI